METPAQDGSPASEERRRIPAVERMLARQALAAAGRSYSRPIVLQATREVLNEVRERAVRDGTIPSIEVIEHSVVARAAAIATGALRPVINASGVIIHTNLGRAPLAPTALVAMSEVGGAYSNLEFDLASGERGSRHEHLERLLCRLTGAEAAIAVNNNAAAMLLALTALASGREVVISRGQLVEIGGGFRIPDVLRQSGAQLVEVGTTNRTYVRDYELAITERTALLLRVHTSNFRVVGFTHDVPLADLASLGARRGVSVVDDLGSGALLDTSHFGLAREPLPQESIAAGAALACFSGDKLLGGPQAGIIVGRKDLVDKLKRHPLARAVRLDKASIAGLQATLLHYLRGEAPECVPIWQMIKASAAELEARGQALLDALSKRGVEATVVATAAAVGGGSLPGETLPSRALLIRSPRMPAQEIAAQLRGARPPVVGRVERDALLLDLRTVLPDQDEPLCGALLAVLG